MDGSGKQIPARSDIRQLRKRDYGRWYDHLPNPADGYAITDHLFDGMQSHCDCVRSSLIAKYEAARAVVGCLFSRPYANRLYADIRRDTADTLPWEYAKYNLKEMLITKGKTS